jgi:hypothetical protein
VKPNVGDGRHSFSLPAVKALWAKSGNRCAFPKCKNPLLDLQTGKPIGRMAHITAAKEGGPRYDPNMPSAKRKSAANGIMLCSAHHDVVDADEESYTVERLQKMKADHETSAPVPELDDATAAQFLMPVNVYSPVDGSVITSINQMGGQTAHSITNMGEQRRQISTAAMKEAVRRLASANPLKIHIAAMMSEPDALPLAMQMKKMFTDAGWPVQSVSQAVFKGIPQGIVLVLTQASPSALLLGDIFLQLGFDCHGELEPGIPADELRVAIGTPT